MADLKISIGIVNETKAGVSSVKSELRGVGDEAEKTGRRLSTLAKPDFSSAIKAIKEYGSQIQNLGQRFTSYGQTLALSLSAPIAAIAALGVKFNSTKEQSITAFSVLLKDGEKAKKLYSELQDFADATPFEAPEVVESGRKLLAAKVPLEEIKGYLKDIGDLSAGTGQNIIDVASAFTRIKAGDFGEAFERLRDFGIARKDLEAEGLKFDKSGQYKGTVEQAMKAVRAIVQRDFGGMMEEQSKTFSGRVSTILDTLNRSLGDLFEPLFNAISEGLPTVIDFITKIKTFIGGLSEPAKIAITVFLGIAAAIAPVLLVLGSVIGFFASIVSGFISVAGAIAAAGGTMALLTTGFTAVAAFVTATLLPALATIAPAIVGVVAVFAVAAAAAVALYAAWQANFGGIRTYTLEAWDFIKSAVQTGITYVYSIVQSVGGNIVGWWRENYPLIRQIVENVSNSIKTTVGAFLETVRQFWQNHGENIFDYVKTYYGYIKSIVGQIIGQLGTIIRFGLQVLTGDWSGAWQSFLQIVRNASKILTTIFYAIKDIFIKFLSAVIPILIEYGVKFGTTLATYIGKAVVGAVYILATLPQRLFELVPKLIAAGASVGSAIWQGIKDGIAGNASNNPITIDIPAPNVAPIEAPQAAAQAAKTVASVPTLDTGKLAEDATRLKETREALAKAELSAQIGLFKNQAEEIQTIYEKGFGQIVEKFKETNDSAQLKDSAAKLTAFYNTEIGQIISLWDSATRQQIEGEKAGNNERLLALKEHEQTVQQFRQLSVDKDAEVQKLITANSKKANEERAKNVSDAFKTLQDAKNQLISSAVNERFGLAEQTQILEAQITKGRELSEVETQLIKNKIELYKYESELRRAGKSDRDIEILTQILTTEQAHTLELLKQLGINKQKIAVQEAIADEDKRIKDEQLKQNEEIQKQYQQTYGFIRGALDTLADSSKSFGEKMKEIFGGIFNSFKQMLLKMVAEYLTSKLFETVKFK